jgi:hypothetical protein
VEATEGELVTGRTKRIVVIGSLATALVIGVGVAVAGGGLGFGSNQAAFLNDAAKRLNVTPAELKAALQGAYGDRLDAAVAAGKITQAEADAMKQRAAQDGGLPFFGGRHGGFGHDRGGLSLDAAATFLGLTQAELRTQLESGKTLADITKAKGKTVDYLKQALTTALKTKLDAAVKAGQLIQAQADEMQARMTSHLDDLVNGTGGPRGHGDGDGHGWGGPPPSGDPQAPAGFGMIAPAGAAA